MEERVPEKEDGILELKSGEKLGAEWRIRVWRMKVGMPVVTGKVGENVVKCWDTGGGGVTEGLVASGETWLHDDRGRSLKRRLWQESMWTLLI